MSSLINPGRSTSSDPIKGYSHKGFALGWCAITIVAIMGFGLLTFPLDYTSADPGTDQAEPVLLPPR